MRQNIVLAVCIALVLPAAIGCGRRPLMPTPNLYLGQDDDPFAEVPAGLQSNKVDVLYVTDRKPLASKDGTLTYGHERSTSMAFGSCIVEIGRDVDWPVLAANSRKKERSVSLELKTRKTTEHARFPSTPLAVVPASNGVKPDPSEVKREKEIAFKLQENEALFGQLEQKPKPLLME